MKETPEINTSIETKEVLESIPSEEGIKLIFNELFEGEDFEQRRKLEDEDGVYLWEAETQTEGGTTEFGYMREGRFPEGSASNSKIYVTFFDETGMPEGGHDVAEYVDGRWKRLHM